MYAGPETGIGVRPLRRGERETVAGVFAGLSDRSRRLRFLAPKPALSSAELAHLADVDQESHAALVATAPGTGAAIGIARYVREGGGESAEIAVAVVDRWQRRGVGRLLIRELIRRAVAAGVARFHATLAPENGAALALVRRAGTVEETAWHGSYVELTVRLC